jgi:predicted MPP superfamily phosphohydrolase
LVKINKIKNVYLLNEKGLTFNNITFYGFNAPYNYYYDGKESNRDLLEESFKIKTKDTYNILLTHSPINLTDADTYEEMDLKRFNLILCGHMHNGLMPHFIPGHMGLVAPFRKFFPYDARGTIKHGKTTFVISGGVEKLSHSAGILHYLNGIYPVSITIIQ